MIRIAIIGGIGSGKSFISKLFGYPVFNADNEVKYIYKKNLKVISSIVHPLVRNRMKKFITKNKKRKFVILDIPLLIENKLNEKKDIIIFIQSKNSKVLQRLKKRPFFNGKLIKSLRENQVILSKKRKLANYIIYNNYSLHIMKKKINIIKKEILNERNSSRY